VTGERDLAKREESQRVARRLRVAHSGSEVSDLAAALPIPNESLSLMFSSMVSDTEALSREIDDFVWRELGGTGDAERRRKPRTGGS